MRSKILAAMWCAAATFLRNGLLAGDVEPFEQRRQSFMDAVWKDFLEHADKPSAKQAFLRAERFSNRERWTKGAAWCTADSTNPAGRLSYN